MATFRTLFFAALVAGTVAGAAASVIQASKMWPLIAAAEVFEAAAPHHDRGAAELVWSPEEAMGQAAGVGIIVAG